MHNRVLSKRLARNTPFLAAKFVPQIFSSSEAASSSRARVDTGGAGQPGGGEDISGLKLVEGSDLRNSQRSATESDSASLLLFRFPICLF